MRYTTNGREPTASSAVYKKPITVKKTTVVKAVAFLEGCLPSEAVSATFLVEKKHSIPVVSVSADPDGLLPPDALPDGAFFLQQLPEGGKLRAAHQPAAHDALCQQIIQGQQAHAQVMGHIAAHGLRLPLTAARRQIQGFV